MINIASRAAKGVIIPNREQTRAKIIDMFKQNLSQLRDRLNVGHVCSCALSHTYRIWSQSDAVSGRVNLTCDAWQASNTDAYFAVTGHWVEEITPGVWRLQTALLGFVRMNCVHSGEKLGMALYKVAECVGIVHKVRMPSYSPAGIARSDPTFSRSDTSLVITLLIMVQ